MWFNTRAVSNEHNKFAKSDRAFFKYSALQHSSGEVSIEMSGRKSGYEIDSSFTTSRRHLVEQGAALRIHFDFPEANAFPDLKCGRCPYLTHKTSISTSDPDYLARIIEVVGTKYDMSAISAKLCCIMDDWLNLDSRDARDDSHKKETAVINDAIDITVKDAKETHEQSYVPPMKPMATAACISGDDVPISHRADIFSLNDGSIHTGTRLSRLSTDATLPYAVQLFQKKMRVTRINGLTLSTENEQRFPLYPFVAEEILGASHPKKKHFGEKRMRTIDFSSDGADDATVKHMPTTDSGLFLKS